MSRLWQHVTSVKGRTNHGGIASVYVPTDSTQDPKQCEEWTKLDDPPEVIAAISGERLKKHFGQSKECTWTSPPLDTTMMFEGTGELAEDILNGTYDVNQLPTCDSYDLVSMATATLELLR